MAINQGEILLSRYRVDGYHAEGSMQTVYKGFDLSLNRDVVIKTPKGTVRDRRFKRGAEMGARINHPNAAATFDYFEDESLDLTFMVEEFIHGKDLGKRLSNEFIFLDPYLAAHVIHHIAKALHEAHRAGICHRDLKPSNIMVSEDFALTNLKLTDFGIAKLAESEIDAEMKLFSENEETLTTSSTLLGAVPYLAPECWSNWKDAGQEIDIWAMGCIAYQLLSGKPPFGMGRLAISNVNKAEHRGFVEIPNPSHFGQKPHVGALESQLMKLILNCLKIKPEERPKTIDVLEYCGNLLYSSLPRIKGEIETYPLMYAGNTRSEAGKIRGEDGALYFFHKSDYFGDQPPAVGQPVSFSWCAGDPNDRASPVLLMKNN